MKLLIKNLLVSLLFLSIGLSGILVYKNTKPSILLSKDTTYFLPGQRNDCLWVIQLNNNIQNQVGSNSEIKIGIPQAQKTGYLAGRIEVGRDNTLILAFNPPTSKTIKIRTPPVVMTADYNIQRLPIRSIRFRWIQSTLITVVLFNDRNVCLASRVRK